jgi:hypothetical protein
MHMELGLVAEKTSLDSSAKPGQHLLARGPRSETFKFGQEIVGECPTRVGCSGLELAVQRVGDVADLNHLRYVASMRACESHVRARRSIASQWRAVR